MFGSLMSIKFIPTSVEKSTLSHIIGTTKRSCVIQTLVLNISPPPRPTSCFGATSGKQERVLGSEQQCAHAIFTSPATNLAPYELNFQLLVRGACLLAGIPILYTHLSAHIYLPRKSH